MSLESIYSDQLKLVKNRRMKKRSIFLLLIFFVAFSFLFSGPPDSKGPNSYCPHQYIRLNAFMGVPVNCDEFVFMGAAAHPGYLIQKDFQRQNRPLYVIFGTFTGYAIYYLTSPIHKQIQSLIEQKFSGQFAPQEIQKSILYGAIYIAFIILNTIILFFSIVLFEKSIYMASGAWKNKQSLLYAFIIMLISNQITKSFFWTAHQQMFTIFTPIACIYTGLFIQKSKPGIRYLLFFSLIPGLLLLVYGNFLLILPVMLYSYFLNLKKENRLSLIPFIINAASITIVFSLPTFLWIITLKLIGLSYYNHEVSAFRHFVWMIDDLKISTAYFLNAFYEHTIDFLKTSGSLLFYVLLLLVAVSTRLINFEKTSIKRKGLFESKAAAVTIFSFLLFSVFLWLIGSYADRLTCSLGPILLFAAALFINERKINPEFQYALIAAILLVHTYTVFFNAPHFSETLFFQ